MHRLMTIALSAVAAGCIAAGVALAGPLLSAGADSSASSLAPSAAPSVIPARDTATPPRHRCHHGDGSSSGTSQAPTSDV